MARAGQIVINISAGTAQFVKDIEEVKGGIRSVGKETANLGSVAQGTGFNIRYAFFGLKDIAEGRTRFAMAELANEMVRLRGAALGIGVAVVVVAAVAYAFTELRNKIKEARDAATEAFNGLLAPVHKTSDELDVTNIRLQNSIALLEHHPQNILAQNLAEGRVEADKLAESLEKDLKELEKVMKDRQVTIWQRVITFSASTTDISEAATNLRKDIRTIDQKGKAAVDAATSQEDKKNAFDAWDKEKKDKLDWYNEWQRKQTERLDVPRAEGRDVGQRTEALEAFSDDVSTQRGDVDKHAAERTLSLTNEQLEAAKKARADAKREADEWLHAKEEALDKQKLTEDLSAYQEVTYWNEILESGDRGTRAALQVAEVVDSIDRKILENKKKIREEQKQANKQFDEEQFKEWEDSIKAAQEQSAHPAALRLQMLKESDPDFADERVQRQIPEAQKAADEESTKILKENLKEQDEAWHESSVRNAAEVRNRATVIRNWLEDVRPMFVGIDALIDEQTARIVTADKAIQEEADKVAKIQIESKEQTDTGANAAKRLQLEQQYAEFRTHSVQEELANAKALGALEAADLQIKLDAAETMHEEAMDEGDLVKIKQADLEIDKARTAIQQQQLQLAIQITTIESQHSATLKQGLDSFIHDANAQMKQPGDILKDGLNSALDQTSDNLTKLMTGQKTKWADEFKSIGREMVKESTKSLLTLGLDKLGLNPKKPLKPPTAIDQWAKGVGVGKVEVVNQQGQGQEQPGQNVVPGGGLGSLGGLFGSGSKGGGIFSMLGGGIGSLFSSGGGAAASGASSGLESVSSSISFPAMAGGGDVDPGRAYMVGEQGPEPFIPRTAGSIIPNSKLGSMGGGGNVTYSIDARGAELGAYNRIQRGIEAAHASAVDQSAKVAHERTRRTPQVSHA